jgi:hypothetical protein
MESISDTTQEERIDSRRLTALMNQATNQAPANISLLQSPREIFLPGESHYSAVKAYILGNMLLATNRLADHGISTEEREQWEAVYQKTTKAATLYEMFLTRKSFERAEKETERGHFSPWRLDFSGAD